MGVNVDGWRKVEFVRPLREGEEGGEEWPALLCLRPADDHPAVADGMASGLYRVSGNREVALAAEYNRTPPDEDQIHCDLGSNQGYNRWLGQLEDAARKWWLLRLFRPFIDLDPVHDPILIGPKTSDKFWKAFAAGADRCEAFARTIKGDDAKLFVRRYRGFLRAFDLAKGGGAVYTS